MLKMVTICTTAGLAVMVIEIGCGHPGRHLEPRPTAYSFGIDSKQEPALLPFDKLEQAHLEACGSEAEFERAIDHIIDVLDPDGKLMLLSAAHIVFEKTQSKPSQGRPHPNPLSVVAAWPQMSPGDRIACVSRWLETLQDKLPK